MLQAPAEGLGTAQLWLLKVVAGVPGEGGLDAGFLQQGVLLFDAVADGAHDGVAAFIFAVAEAQVDDACVWLMSFGVVEPAGEPDGRRGGGDGSEGSALVGAPEREERGERVAAEHDGRVCGQIIAALDYCRENGFDGFQRLFGARAEILFAEDGRSLPWGELLIPVLDREEDDGERHVDRIADGADLFEKALT